MISREMWMEAFEGFYIYDCAVRRNDIFCFLLIQKKEGGDQGEPATRLVSVFNDGSGDVGFGEYTGFELPKISVSRNPEEQAIMISLDGDVAVLGGGENDLEKKIPMGKRNSALLSSAVGIATIDGDIYAVGGWRSVCRRIGSGKWQNLADRASLPESKGTKNGLDNGGFSVIDGFNAHDIYCGGGKGDLWHFDGSSWEQCPVPTNMYVESICCAGDGFVYVGLQSGSVMRGRNDKWKVIHVGSLTLPFKDMVWYEDKVWCTSDYGIWTIEDGKYIEPDLSAKVRSCSGNLSVGDGVMLLAGMYGASVYNGKKWTTLIPPSM